MLVCDLLFPLHNLNESVDELKLAPYLKRLVGKAKEQFELKDPMIVKANGKSCMITVAKSKTMKVSSFTDEVAETKLERSAFQHLTLELLKPQFSSKIDQLSLKGNIHLQVIVNGDDPVSKLLSLFSEDFSRQLLRMRLPLVDRHLPVNLRLDFHVALPMRRTFDFKQKGLYPLSDY